MMTKGVGQPLWCYCIFKNSWQLVQEGRRGCCKKQRAHLISLGNYGGNSPKATSIHIKDKKGTGKINKGSTKVKSCLTNLVVFHNLEDKGGLERGLVTSTSVKQYSLWYPIKLDKLFIMWESWTLERSKTQLDAAHSRASSKGIGEHISRAPCQSELLWFSSIINQAWAPNTTLQSL